MPQLEHHSLEIRKQFILSIVGKDYNNNSTEEIGQKTKSKIRNTDKPRNTRSSRGGLEQISLILHNVLRNRVELEHHPQPDPKNQNILDIPKKLLTST